MIGYDGPARVALLIIAGCVVLTGLAICVGKVIAAGDLDAPDPDGETVDDEEIVRPADVVSLAGHRALRPRDDIAAAAERVLANAPMPPKDAS